MKYVVYLTNLRKELKKSFTEKNIDTNDVDCILMEVLHKSFTELTKDELLSTPKIDEIMRCVKERQNGKPVTKIVNKAHFYGYEFFVDENVLSPRSETELLVDLALDFIKNHSKVRVLDLCTGSGAIACAIYKKSTELGLQNKITVVASDVSTKALDVAKKNADMLNCNIQFVQSDMFDNITGDFDLIVSNPPYIETEVCKTLEREVKDFDPILALDGGAAGVNFYRIIKLNLNRLKTSGMCVMEIGYNQGESIKELFGEFAPQIKKDYSNNDRIVVIKK